MTGRSLGEPALVKTLDHIVEHGHPNESQLAAMLRGLIDATGDTPQGRAWIDAEAARVLNEGDDDQA